MLFTNSNQSGLFGHFAVALIFMAMIATAQAQEEAFLEPMSIVVNTNRELSVDVWLNRRRADGRPVTYRVGERIEIGARASEDAYFYVFNINNHGSVTQIFPNGHEGLNRVQAGRNIYIGAPNASYNLTVSEPVGTDWVFVLASRQPLNTASLANRTSPETMFAAGSHTPMSFANTVAGLLSSVPINSWASNQVLFNTTR